MITADVMSRSVVAISPDAPLAQAVRLMVDHRVSGLPVIDPQGRPVGMLTEGDLLRRVETGTEGKAPGWFASFFMSGHLAGRYVQTHGRSISDIMTPDVTTVTESTPLSEVVELMQRKRIKRLPVVRSERVIGIVSRADLVRAIAGGLDTPVGTANDASIRRAIRDELERQAWAPKNAISIAVADGVVLLDGCVLSLRQAEAIRVLAENVPGVQRVENRIICIDPSSGMVIYDPSDPHSSMVVDRSSQP